MRTTAKIFPERNWWNGMRAIAACFGVVAVGVVIATTSLETAQGQSIVGALHAWRRVDHADVPTISFSASDGSEVYVEFDCPSVNTYRFRSQLNHRYSQAKIVNGLSGVRLKNERKGMKCTEGNFCFVASVPRKFMDAMAGDVEPFYLDFKDVRYDLSTNSNREIKEIREFQLSCRR